MTSLDQLLARDAEAWRAEVDRRLTPEADLVLNRPGRRPRRTVAAAWLSAAAVVVLALVISVVAIRGGSGAGGIQPGATDPVHPSIPPSFRQGTARVAPELSRAQADNLTSMPWKLDAVNNAASTIEIRFIIGDTCMTARGSYVRESDTSVVIAVLTHNSGDHACGDSLAIGKYSVRLNAPLGNRTLRHAKVTGGQELAGQLDD